MWASSAGVNSADRRGADILHYDQLRFDVLDRIEAGGLVVAVRVCRSFKFVPAARIGGLRTPGAKLQLSGKVHRVRRLARQQQSLALLDRVWLFGMLNHHDAGAEISQLDGREAAAYHSGAVDDSEAV